MKYVIDIDGTICKEVIIPDSGGKKDYANHIPMPERIAKVNALHEAGHTIKYMTARGCVSGIDYYDLTMEQLLSWGCKFQELSLDNRVKTMNHDVIRIDTVVSNALGLRPDVDRISRADGKTDARRD